MKAPIDLPRIKLPVFAVVIFDARGGVQRIRCLYVRREHAKEGVRAERDQGRDARLCELREVAP